MKMTGMFHIALLPDANEAAFVKRMTEIVFKEVDALQLTRITKSFTHRLLKRQSRVPAYVWQVSVDLVTDQEYNFDENVARVQSAVKGMGLVTSLDVYRHLGPDA